MNNSLYIGEVVYSLLSTITETGTRCYPIIAENSTSMPFLVYQRDTLIRTSLTKDGYGDDEVQVSVKVIATGYKEALDIAQQVRTKLTLNNYSHTDNNNNVVMRVSSKLIAAYESFEENCYIQTLTFDMSVI